jgi:hypothetical protein
VQREPTGCVLDDLVAPSQFGQVRLGLAVGPATTETDRFAWGLFGAPRVVGRGPAESLPPLPLAPAEEVAAQPARGMELGLHGLDHTHA